MADAGGGRVLRIAQPDAGKPPAVEVLADRFEGKPFDAPNDVALDLAGNVYFSDPGQLQCRTAHRLDLPLRCEHRQARAARYGSGLSQRSGRHAGPEAALPGRECAAPRADLRPDARRPR